MKTSEVSVLLLVGPFVFLEEQGPEITKAEAVERKGERVRSRGGRGVSANINKCCLSWFGFLVQRVG